MELPITTTRTAPDRALVSARRIEQLTREMTAKRSVSDSIKSAAAAMSTPQELHEHLARPESQRGTVLYLAYGSNLSNETFRGNRGILFLKSMSRYHLCGSPLTCLDCPTRSLALQIRDKGIQRMILLEMFRMKCSMRNASFQTGRAQGRSIAKIDGTKA
jgi:hypothetical protein